MLHRIKMMSIDAMGNPDRRVTDIHNLVRSNVERKYCVSELSAQVAALKKLCDDVASTGEITNIGFLQVLEVLGVWGSIEDKLALFDRFDIEERGTLDAEHLCRSIFGLERAPIAQESCRGEFKKLRDQLLKKAGPCGLRFFVIALEHAYMQAASCTVDQEALLACMTRFGVCLNSEDVRLLSQHLCSDANNTQVDVREFVKGLRGRMSLRRRRLVDLAWKGVVARCSAKASDSIPLPQIEAIFDASAHPSVKDKLRAREDILRDFRLSWDDGPATVVSNRDFVKYHMDIGALVESDSAFESLVKGVWHVAPESEVPPRAAQGVAAVIVTCLSGNQILQNLNGIPFSAKEKINEMLEKKGIHDVSRIDPWEDCL